MKFKFNKLTLINSILIVSLLINTVQYFNYHNCNKKQYGYADMEFNLSIEGISNGIDDVKTKGSMNYQQ